jgi:hypothetical protein
MKRLIVILFLACLVVFVQGQTSKPCAADFTVKARSHNKALNTDSLITSLSKWQFATGVTAVSFNLKTGIPSVLSSAGFGMIKSTYKLKTDKVTVYKTFTDGGMLLLGDTQQTPLFNLPGAKVSSDPAKIDYGVMVVGGYGPFTLGPTYFVVSQTVLLNLQATFTF